MKLSGTVVRLSDGHWKSRHESPEVGQIETTAATRELAIEKLQGEIRYRLELCPCSGDSYQHIDIEIVESAQ